MASDEGFDRLRKAREGAPVFSHHEPQVPVIGESFFCIVNSRGHDLWQRKRAKLLQGKAQAGDRSGHSYGFVAEQVLIVFHASVIASGSALGS